MLPIEVALIRDKNCFKYLKEKMNNFKQPDWLEMVNEKPFLFYELVFVSVFFESQLDILEDILGPKKLDAPRVFENVINFQLRTPKPNVRKYFLT